MYLYYFRVGLRWHYGGVRNCLHIHNSKYSICERFTQINREMATTVYWNSLCLALDSIAHALSSSDISAVRSVCRARNVHKINRKRRGGIKRKKTKENELN